MTKDAQETRIKRGHMTLMKHRDTALYSGVMLMGSSEVADNVPTAYTDGVNKKYGRKFLESIADESKVRGLILHENLHVALKQIAHGRSMFKDNPKLANLAADFVVNDVIVNITATLPNSRERLVELPDGGFYDPMFHDWSMRQVFNYLKKNCKDKNSEKDGEVEVNGKTYDLSNGDEHDFPTEGDTKDINDKVDRALREGGMLRVAWVGICRV